MKYWARGLVLVFILGLNACGVRTITSDVTRFHFLPPLAGGSVDIVAKDAQKADSIEFSGYAGLVGSALSRFGYSRAGDGLPDYIVLIDYFQRPLTRPDDDERGRMSVGIGGGSSGHTSVGVGFGTSFGLGGERRQIAARIFTLELESRESGERLFEGRVQSHGLAENFSEVIPHMIDALFDGFPGNSGDTVTVRTTVK